MEKTLTISDYRNYGLLMGLFFVAFFGALLPWIFGRAYMAWPWIVASVFWAVALLVPSWLKPVYKYWMIFAEALGFVQSRILLGVVFFVVMTPLSICRRWIRKDPLRLKWDPTIQSYRSPAVSSKITPSYFEKPY